MFMERSVQTRHYWRDVFTLLFNEQRNRRISQAVSVGVTVYTLQNVSDYVQVIFIYCHIYCNE